MSIPSVNFNRSPIREIGSPRSKVVRRTRRRGNDNPYLGNINPMMNINLSSSSDSDDVPVIQTKVTNSNPVLLDFESDSSSSSSSDDLPGGINGNWKAAKINPPIRVVEPPQPSCNEQHIRKRRPSHAPRGNIIENENNHAEKVHRSRRTNENNSDDENNQNEVPKTHQRRKVVKRVRKVRKQIVVEEESENEQQKKEEEEEKSEEEEVKVVRRRRKTSSDEKSQSSIQHTHEEEKNETESSETKSSYVPDPIPEGISNFTMIRTKKTFGASNYHMVADEKCVFACELSEDKMSKYYIITRKFPAKMDSKSYQGFLRVHEHGHRFTLVSNFERENDDRDGELLGVCFTKGTTGRKMRIAMTRDLVPFFPISKRLNLSRLAKDEKENSNFDYLETVQSPNDDFGSELTIKSVKNFKMTDPKTGDLIFQIYKYADGQYNVKCAAPLNPFVAFGLAVACITSE